MQTPAEWQLLSKNLIEKIYFQALKSSDALKVYNLIEIVLYNQQSCNEEDAFYRSN